SFCIFTLALNICSTCVKRNYILILIAVVIVDAAAIYWYFCRPAYVSDVPDLPAVPAAPESRPASTPIQFRALPLPSSAASEPPAAPADSGTTGSPLAADLNAPDGTAQQDVQTLHALLRLYMRAMHNRQGPPIGDDIDLSKALTGHNPSN